MIKTEYRIKDIGLGYAAWLVQEQNNIFQIIRTEEHKIRDRFLIIAGVRVNDAEDGGS